MRFTSEKALPKIAYVIQKAVEAWLSELPTLREEDRLRLLEFLYRSQVGILISMIARFVARFQKPFMVYGFRDPSSKAFRKVTRVSSNVIIMNLSSLSMGDHVWVWHHSILDATEGLSIGEGCQVGAWVGIFTHGSENSIRLLGQEFADYERIANELNTDVYFAHSYSSWQRATNENMNALIRQYFPKKPSFATITESETEFVMERLSNRPRKCLGFKSPN